MWNPCLPGDRPLRSAVTRTSSPRWVKVALPVTFVLLGCVAAAFEGLIVAIAVWPPSCIFDDDDLPSVFLSELHPINAMARHVQAINDAMREFIMARSSERVVCSEC